MRTDVASFLLLLKMESGIGIGIGEGSVILRVSYCCACSLESSVGGGSDEGEVPEVIAMFDACARLGLWLCCLILLSCYFSFEWREKDCCLISSVSGCLRQCAVTVVAVSGGSRLSCSCL